MTENGNNKTSLLELMRLISLSVKSAFPESYWVAAEINEVRESVSGHCYLELIEKDGDQDRIVARSKATVWSYTWRMLKPYFETSTSKVLSKGMAVLVEVTVEFHELYGTSLNIKDIDPVYTIGDLEKKRAEIIIRLEKEGIKDMNRSLTFPVLPANIAVISSPLAAGYEDFMHQIKNNPRGYAINLTLFQALMQGDEAAGSIVRALDAVFESEKSFDVVVILRGGGSASDLNCFDSYEVASHIAQFPLPVVTGIGHERDRTIADIIAHTDLKTPTAVAEFILSKFHEFDQNVSNLSIKLANLAIRIIQNNSHFLDKSLKDIPKILNTSLIQKYRYLATTGTSLAKSSNLFIRQNRNKLDSNHTLFEVTLKNQFTRLKNYERDTRLKMLPAKVEVFTGRKSDRLELYDKTLQLLDPENVLKKGYTLVMQNEKIVKSAENIDSENIMETKFYNGRIKSKIEKITIFMKDK